MIAIAIPHRKTPWRACAKAVRNSACILGGSLAASAGLSWTPLPRRWTTAAGRCESWLASRAAKIAPKIATPNEPPIERKNVAVAVATPMFARLGVVLDDEHEHLHDEADADADDEHVDGREPGLRCRRSRRESRNMPTTRIPVPAIGNIR